MERRFEEKTVRKALQRGYVDAQRLLASPSQMQKFLLRLEEKEEVVRTVGEPLAAVPVLERLLRRYLDGEYTAISAAAMAQVSDGAIVGSAIVKLFAKYGREAVPHVAEYVRNMKKAVVSS